MKTEQEIEQMQRAANQAEEYASRLAEEIRDQEIALATANANATALWDEFLMEYQEFHGEPWQAPEPRYREIPGLE
jgi:hypothetical protein